MNMKKTLVTTAMWVTAVAVGFAADPNVGSWKLNEAKSKTAAGAPKNLTVVYTAEGDSYKCVVDGVDGAGKPAHNEWTGKFDGKDYPLTGDPSADTRSQAYQPRSLCTNQQEGWQGDHDRHRGVVRRQQDADADGPHDRRSGQESDEHRGVRKTVASVPAGRSHRPQPATGPS